MILINLIKLILLFSSVCFGQQIENKLQLNYNFGYEFHNSNFRTIDSIPTCCFNINSGFSTSNNIALNYKIKLLEDFNLGLNLSYSSLNSKVNAFKNEDISIDGIEYLGKFEYAVEAQIKLLNYSLDFDYKLLDKFFINAKVGWSKVAAFDYYQYEKLVSPSDRGYFVKENGVKSRLNNEFRGKLNLDKVNPTLSIGAYYELPLNKTKTLNLVPNINYKFQFGEIVPNTSWNFNGLSFGIALNYYFHKDSAIYINEKYIDRTLLLAPTYISKNSEKLKNSIQFERYNFDIDLFDIGLSTKKKKINFNKNVPVDDSLRFYYKFDKFSGIKEISLIISDDSNKEAIPLNQNNNKIDFHLPEIMSKYSNLLTANIKLIDKQRVYVKNAYSVVEKEYYSNAVNINFEEISNISANLSIFRWQGANDSEDNIENIINNINNKNNIKYIYSNSELGLKLTSFLDNAKIVYNPQDKTISILKDILASDYYIVIYETKP